MPLYEDRVQETTTTTGTGTLTLLGAVAGYTSFSSAESNGERVVFCTTDGTNWEVCDGIFTLAGTTLSRDNVYSSSNAGALVNWGAGTKNVFITQGSQAIADLALSIAMREFYPIY